MAESNVYFPHIDKMLSVTGMTYEEMFHVDKTE